MRNITTSISLLFIFVLTSCGSGGGGGAACGGAGNVTCPAGQFCLYSDLSCGAGGTEGSCEAVPASCDATVTTVCSCEGLTFSNECYSNAAYQSVLSAGTCGSNVQSTVTTAANVCSGKIVPIESIPGGGVLYKPENLHGGRGPSFLVQNVSQRTNKQVIEVRNARCETIATLGLFRTDFPYGSRYYSKSGGSGQEDTELLRLAQLAGSTNILIEGVNGSWIRVRNPVERDGSVVK